MAASSMSMAAAALEAMIEVVMGYERKDGSEWQTTSECGTGGPAGVY